MIIVRIDLVDFELDGGSQIGKPCDRDSVTVGDESHNNHF